MSSPVKPLPSQHDVRYWWNYNPETGRFTWRNSPNTKIKIGQEAGDINGGHRRTRLSGEIYPIARLIWVYMTGEEPQGWICFKNSDPRDLRWENLEDCLKPRNQFYWDRRQRDTYV